MTDYEWCNHFEQHHIVLSESPTYTNKIIESVVLLYMDSNDSTLITLSGCTG